MADLTNTEGFCFCGCGGKTTIPKHNDRSVGDVAGVPRKWIFGHARRKWQHVAVDWDTGCWITSLAPHRNGYVHAYIGGKYRRAHRAFYEKYRGSIGKELVLDHLCRRKCCVNPWHLEAVKQRVNLRRGLRPTLNETQVKDLRERYKNGATKKALSNSFGVSETTVQAVVTWKTWRDVH